MRVVGNTKPITAVASPEPVTIPQEIAAPPEPIIVAAPETSQPEVSALIEEAQEEPSVVTAHEPLPWYGAGNVVSYVGITLLSLIAGE